MGARGLFAYFFTVVVLAGYADATDLRAWSALPDVCEEFVNLKLLKGIAVNYLPFTSLSCKGIMCSVQAYLSGLTMKYHV